MSNDKHNGIHNDIRNDIRNDVRNDVHNESEVNDDAFLENVREELDHSCDRLDGHTQSRLNSIRHAALEHGRRRNPILAPFGGLVTACVMVLAVSVYFTVQPEMPVQAVPDSQQAIEDLDLLTSSESLELLENLEFYQWLEENDASV